MEANTNIAAEQLNIPPIVRIVLSQMAQMRSTGCLDERTFEANLQRLRREELQPRGLSLSIQELSSGCSRFVIQSGNGAEGCEWIEGLSNAQSPGTHGVTTV
ncbi:MAG: hypothetical protein EOP84_15480 [Verrucomicrobiaceae bacterium]|nr:MAG: hypothetical protein EOP84_15480 [Verrucomicrobiaceae bacterium]